jgi:hypothetical protein
MDRQGEGRYVDEMSRRSTPKSDPFRFLAAIRSGLTSLIHQRRD